MQVCARDGFAARSRKCAAVRSTTERQLAASGIELGAAAGVLLKDLAGCEANTIALGQALEIADHTLRTQVVGIAQRSPAKRRKTESKDRADVAVARISHDALTKRARRFVHQAEHQTLEDLRRSGPAVRMNTEQPIA